MRVYGKRSQGPSWITALLIFLGLLVVLQFFRLPSNRSLEDQFAAASPVTGPGAVALPPLPSSVADLARTAVARIGAGGSGAPLTPVAQTADLRIEIGAIAAVSDGLRVTGVATNIGQQPLVLSLGAFRFTDGSGTVYTPQQDIGTTLDPGQRVPLDLVLPIQDRTQLILDVEAPDQPLRMVLLQTR